ncbi:MAG: hypothetical protein II458_03560 [Oscillospiraceae bacterium]|nr:hypothetical protein [Oscillospiraceae bacterium]
MSFLQRVGNAVSRFMYGRNGLDQLGRCMLWLLIGVNVISIFLRSGLLGAIFSVLSTLLAVCLLFRFFSRNLYRRRAENAVFLNKVWYPIRRRFSGTKNRVMDREHCYFTCDRCRAVCRVPKGKGTIIITCPRCGNQIHAKS